MKPNPPLVALLIFVFTIALYVFAVKPMSAALDKAKNTLATDELRLASMQTEIGLQSSLKDRIDGIIATNAVNRKSYLTPMLNSNAMRAKSLLDSMATECGINGVEYSEGTFRALPVPKSQMPMQRTARRSVKISAKADYAALASFVLRIERDLPMACVQSLTMVPGKGGGDLQEVTMFVEWPCEGEVIK